jgi:hypothetical protein
MLGCQIFLGTMYLSGEKYQITTKYTKWPKIYQMAKNISNGHKIYQMAIK